MKNERSEAKPAKDQSPDRDDQEALENKSDPFPSQCQRNSDGQRECSRHSLSKSPRIRSRQECDAPGLKRQGPIVQSVEGIPAWDKRAPPEHCAESKEYSRLLQDDGHKNHQADEARLEEESGILNRASGRRRLGKTLLEDEVSFQARESSCRLAAGC
jgi:hypothetical protein